MTETKKTLTPEEKLANLEAHLAGTLKPVAPPMRFTQRMQARIRFPYREEITLRLTDWRRLFFVFSGVISGMLLLITFARAFYYLVGRKA
ncbi:MAG: hypothetical protein PHQ36_13775 [Anaerolineales bacterium]|nr:hypothetical protein [Anaerolineales bacterium]